MRKNNCISINHPVNVYEINFYLNFISEGMPKNEYKKDHKIIGKLTSSIRNVSHVLPEKCHGKFVTRLNNIMK